MEPAKSGVETSEFKVMSVMVLLGVALDVAGIILGAARDAGLANPWLPVALVIVGMATKVLAAQGYTRSRTIVKAAALQSDLAGVLKEAAPLLRGEMTDPSLKQPPL